jgi:hypothetical protein
MNKLFFRIKEKIYREGPIFNTYFLNYKIGIVLLKKLIELRSFQKYRATEIENLTTVLGILTVPTSQYESIISHYLFNNTWQKWKSLHYEQPWTFQKYWDLEGKEKIEEFYQNNQVIIFLYRHTPLTDHHQSLMRFGLEFKFITLGNTPSKKILLQNGQTDLPEEITNNPFKYRAIVRNQQLKKIVAVLNKAERYAVNYFFDGQEGGHFRIGQVGGLRYQLSTSLLRFLRPHTQLVMVEPSFAFDGSVTVQFHEVPCFVDFAAQFGYVQNYYERTLLSSLPTLNEYMIKCLIKNHHALKDSN